jgi:hypothetical protein
LSAYKERAKRVAVAASAACGGMPFFREIQKPEEERKGASDFPQIRGGHLLKLPNELLLVGARITFAQSLSQRANLEDPLREDGPVLLGDHPLMRAPQERKQFLVNSIYPGSTRHLKEDSRRAADRSLRASAFALIKRLEDCLEVRGRRDHGKGRLESNAPRMQHLPTDRKWRQRHLAEILGVAQDGMA